MSTDNAKPWVYDHMVRTPYDKTPYAQPWRYTTREDAEAARKACRDMRGCSGSCRRAGAGSGDIHLDDPNTQGRHR